MAIAACVLKDLEQLGLDIVNVRGQGYDGASNMSSAHVGLQALIREKSPLAVYTHCTGHCLTLSRAMALFGTTRDLIEWARALFGTISIWPTLSSHSSRSLRLSLKPIYNRHCLVLFYLCTKL